MTEENTQALRMGEGDFNAEFFGSFFVELDIDKFCLDNNIKLKANIFRSFDKIIISYKFLAPDKTGAELFILKRYRPIIETSIGIPGNSSNENIDAVVRTALISVMKSLKYVKP
jgi:hypothetical protein